MAPVNPQLDEGAFARFMSPLIYWQAKKKRVSDFGQVPELRPDGRLPISRRLNNLPHI